MRREQAIVGAVAVSSLGPVPYGLCGRAAFGAGIKPTQIARQFGLSEADVRKALASDEKKR